MGEQQEKNTYRLQGLTCANCAQKFEKNTKDIAGVSDARINFGASKLTVYGQASIEELEKAGAFDSIKVYPEKQRMEELKKGSFLKRNVFLFLSLLFLIGGWMIGEGLISVLFYSVSMLIGGYRLFLTGLKNLFRLQFDMKTLMTVAIIGAAAIGEWGEGATVVILFAISEALESYSMNKARQSIRSLMDIAPREAVIRRGSNEIKVDVDEIEIGDIMLVKPGQKIAMDGLIIKGESSVNQSAITGESIPVAKAIDDEVFAGTLNEEGYLEVKVTKQVEDTAIAKIIHLVEEAQAERAPSQAFVDKFAKYYTPAIMIIALLIAILPPLVIGGDWSEWIYRGLTVLVVGCPCALVISTPIAIVTAIGNAAKNGVLIKGGVYLEEAGAIDAIAFDKTGTLTKGTPVVTDIISLNGDEESVLLQIAAALERNSGHPLAASIVRKAEELSLDINSLVIAEFHSLTGKGVKGRIGETEYFVGSPSLVKEILGEKIDEEVASFQSQGKTVMVLFTKSHVLALFAVADEIRETSQSVIKKLQNMGVHKTIMLTGDNHQTANAIAKRIGISDVEAELLPEDKLRRVKALRETYKGVAMVGDGVNDAPALAASTVGIAMGGAGTDTALETADIALMADDLHKLPFTIRLSRKTLRIIKENISFSLGIKLLALLLIIPGWLTLWMAIFADMGATLLVTLNSLRLLRIKE
ncbi:cadmium-translocating P-type ATPase [Bacillus timonensis]|nr:cadmium-translocating P-type ATPase [Bacillus timonensis]